MTMHIIEILHQDHKRNHPDSSGFSVSIEEILNKVTQGYTLSRFPKTVIIHTFQGAVGDGVEFHCYNAGTGDELSAAVLKFFDYARQAGSSWCMTPYQNPRISELFQQHIPAERLTIVETPTGFEATVRL